MLSVQIMEAQGNEYVTLKHPPSMTNQQKKVNEIAFTQDKKNVATIGVTWNIVFLWNTETGEMLDQLEGHEKAIFHLAFSMDGRYIAVSGEYDRITIFDVEKREKKHFIDLIPFGSPDYDEWEQHYNSISKILFSPDGERLIAIFSRWIFVVETMTGEVIHQFKFGTDEYPAPSPPRGKIDFLLDGNRIIVRFGPGYKIIDTISGKIIRSEHVTGKSFYMLSEDKKSFYSLQSTGVEDETQLLEWDVETGESKGIKETLYIRSSDDVISPDLNYVLHGKENSEEASLTKVSDKSTALDLTSLNQNIFSKETTCKVFSPDGKTIGYGAGGDAYLIDISHLTSHVPYANELKN